MADLVEYQLDDGSTVLFESAEASLVSLHGGDPDVKDGGRLSDRLSAMAKTCGKGRRIPFEQRSLSDRMIQSPIWKQAGSGAAGTTLKTLGVQARVR